MPQLPFFCYRDLVLLICFSGAILCLQAKICLLFLCRHTGEAGFLAHPWASCINLGPTACPVLCFGLTKTHRQREALPCSLLGNVAPLKA